MRWKIIAVNAVIMAVVGLLTFLLLSTSLAGVLSNPGERKQQVWLALRAGNAQLALDALRLERWLAEHVATEEIRGVFAAGTEKARQESATSQANNLYKAAVAEADFTKMAPSLVLVVDAQGVALGRNGSNLMRGEKIAEAYPSLGDTLKVGTTKSDLWFHKSRQEQLLVSYAPVRGNEGEIAGAVIVGTPLNDERLARTSELSSGFPLALGVMDGDRMELVARSGSAAPEVLAAAGSPAVIQDARSAVETGQARAGDVVAAHHLFGAMPLVGYGDGKRAVLIAAVPESLVPSRLSLLWPVLAVAGLGLLLVAVGGSLLGNYWARPIADIEDGLLAIINGRTDMRFEMEHPELGGLVFRINSLLNVMMGVPEDTTDDQGRPSRPPSPGHFQEALAVDETSAAAPVDPAYAAELAAEPPSQYYARVFRDYIQAKQRIGDPVDQITQAAFVQRLQDSEQEMQQKHGRKVRYKVELRDNAVVLIAVPIEP